MSATIDFTTFFNLLGTDTGNLKIQVGWGYVQGNGTNNNSKAITFPNAYTGTPVVFCTSIGYKSGSNPTSISDMAGIANSKFSALSTGSTGFTAQYLDSSNPASTLRIMFIWLALGS